MKTELWYLVLVTALTAVLWIPYILDRVLVWGLVDAVGYPANPKPQSPWAQRLIKAHGNAVENLVIFAPLVLALQIVGVSTTATATACMVYFFVRAAHIVFYTFAVPLLRTVAFIIGVACQMTLALTLLQVI